MKDGGIDGVVCSGGSHLLSLAFSFLTSPAVVSPTSLDVTPPHPSGFTVILIFQQFITFPRGGISLTQLTGCNNICSANSLS